MSGRVVSATCSANTIALYRIHEITDSFVIVISAMVPGQGLSIITSRHESTRMQAAIQLLLRHRS